MKIPKLYFDTSIFNFAIATDVPKEREVTLKLFDEVRSFRFEVYISEVVLKEINEASSFKAKQLISLINEFEFPELKINEETKTLADEYVRQNVIPITYLDDALHIAIASVNNLDALVSWNFTHIVKLKTKRMVTGINAVMGYKEIEIYSPWEVVENV